MNKQIFEKQLDKRVCEIKNLIEKTNKLSILIISQHPIEEEDELRLPYVRESISNIICFAEVGDTEMIPMILEKVQGVVDKIILDVDQKRTNSKEIIRAVVDYKQPIPIGYYSDLDMWSNAATDFIAKNEGLLMGKHILVLGNNFLSTRIIQNLLQRGALVYMPSADLNNGEFELGVGICIKIVSDYLLPSEKHDVQYDAIVGCNIMSKVKETLSVYQAKDIYDIGLNNFRKDDIQIWETKGSNIFRFDMRAGISGVILNLMETDFLIEHILGIVHIGDITIISGGLMGIEGSIVVDNVYNPQKVLGVANGEGLFKADEELNEIDLNKVNKINNLIEQSL